MGVIGQRHAPAALNPLVKDPGTHWTEGWVDPRVGLDTEARGKILCLCRGSNFKLSNVQYQTKVTLRVVTSDMNSCRSYNPAALHTSTHKTCCCCCLFRSGDNVSELRPISGVLLVPQIIYGYGELRWNDIDSGKSKNSQKTMFQCHFSHHKHHVD
jgi:hypothetical protein